MELISKEQYRNYMDELAKEDLEPVRRAEIHAELTNNYNLTMAHFEQREKEKQEVLEKYHKANDAMAMMYGQLHAKNLDIDKPSEIEEQSYQESVTISELLGQRRR
jgi:hypothetical protein